ncbi:SlyX family protein [Spongiibacter marinus]|jgi:SlyX protein|uniref:SlyX family protein n=1 Tax=Spongiibacter marinus TaxID=354246 RepID=UPI0004258D3F|nr:SlyX family protein [Spongiibacter marinus]
MSSRETEQLVELQTQLAYQEDLLNALNDRVSEQDGELRILRQQLRQLAQASRVMRETMEEQGLAEPGFAAEIEKPPHY